MEYHVRCKQCEKRLKVNANTIKELQGIANSDRIKLKTVFCDCGCMNVLQIDNEITEHKLEKSISNMRYIAGQVSRGQTKSKKKSKQIVKINKELNSMRERLLEEYDNYMFIQFTGEEHIIHVNNKLDENVDPLENAKGVFEELKNGKAY